MRPAPGARAVGPRTIRAVRPVLPRRPVTGGRPRLAARPRGPGAPRVCPRSGPPRGAPPVCRRPFPVAHAARPRAGSRAAVPALNVAGAQLPRRRGRPSHTARIVQGPTTPVPGRSGSARPRARPTRSGGCPQPILPWFTHSSAGMASSPVMRHRGSHGHPHRLQGSRTPFRAGRTCHIPQPRNRLLRPTGQGSGPP